MKMLMLGLWPNMQIAEKSPAKFDFKIWLIISRQFTLKWTGTLEGMIFKLKSVNVYIRLPVKPFLVEHIKQYLF